METDRPHSPTVPAERVNLRLLLVTGETHNFLFNPDDCAEEITEFVYNNWPEGENRRGKNGDSGCCCGCTCCCTIL
uniref:Rad60-SLD_2 domain-containing protein n=1 Tax=Macrostomum lignano TaxID=282301 RepID=A0A1I8GZT6_9PLAT